MIGRERAPSRIPCGLLRFKPWTSDAQIPTTAAKAPCRDGVGSPALPDRLQTPLGDGRDVRGMIEKAKPEDAEEICRTILDSFHAFVAPDYSPEGIEFFHSISTPDECARRLAGGNPAWIERGSDGAVDGYIELRDGHHVTRFFVAPDRIGIGIGKALHKVAESHCRDAGLPRMTVFSSPFALGVYERLGYVSTGAEESPNGLRFVPMEKSLATVAA